MTAMIRKHIILSAFFAFLLVCLLLGDGAQMLIDIVGAVGVLVFVVIAYLYGKRERELPHVICYLWIATIVYFIIRTFFSDDIGYSVYSTIRLIDAFLIFDVLYCYTNDDDRAVFPKYMLGFSCLALCLSIIYTLVPFLRNTLPNTNLLVPSYGHNNIVDILLFGIPIAFFFMMSNKKAVYRFIFISLLLGVLVSFARGVMVIVSFFIIFTLLFLYPKISIKIRILLGIFLCSISVLISVLILFPQTTYSKYFPKSFYPQRTKNTDGTNNRFEYFRQAAEAIRERPLFGSGPGTFILQSKRLQNKPDSYSRFTHNFFLEQLTEIGIVGTAFLIMILVWSIVHIWRTYRKESKQVQLLLITFTSCIVLQSLNASFDFTLDLFIILMLYVSFFAIMLSYDTSYKLSKTLATNISFTVSIILVFVFYIMAGFCSIGFGKRIPFISNHCYLSEFYSTESLKNSSPDISKNALLAINRYHIRNSLVLLQLARYYEIHGVLDRSKKFFDQAFIYNPKNVELYQEYLKFASLHLTGQEIGFVLAKSRLSFFQEPIKKQIKDVDFLSDLFIPEYSPEIFDTIKSDTSFPLYFAKLYYILGVNVIENDPQSARKLWQLARDIYPDMGLLYHELASLELFVFNNLSSAQKIITECMKVPHAALHCKQLTTSLDNVTPPGFVAQDIISYK